MKLEGLCETFEALAFPKIGERAHPDEHTVRLARGHIVSAVSDDEFLADCFSHELGLLEADLLGQGLVPFFRHPELGMQFAFGYWAPGATPGPHEHTAWTITAVCRNELEIEVYDREESYRRGALVSKCRFEAEAGEVGFIHAPCIHAPVNASRNWSLSFHVTSPRDGEGLEEAQEAIPELRVPLWSKRENATHPYARVVQARRRVGRIRQIVQVAADLRSPRARDVLARCRRLAPFTTGGLQDCVLPGFAAGDRPAHSLARVHPDLDLSVRDEEHVTVLCSELPAGQREELAINSLAREAIKFVAGATTFDISELPGNLSPEERVTIAEALENSGLYESASP